MTKIILIIIIIFHSLILSKLIFFPFPELFIYPYLTNHGLKPYSQILDQHFPGLLFLPINLDSLGMTTPDMARIWLISIVIITQILLFTVTREVLKSSRKAILVNILYLVWQPFFEGWVLWIDNFLPLFLLPAFYFSIKRKYVIVGLILGLAVIFKQTVAPLSILMAGFILYDTREIKYLIFYLLGLIFPVFLMLAYLFNIGVFYDFWYWTIVFNLTVYAKLGTKIPPTIGFVTRALLIYLASIFGLFFKERRVMSILFIFLVGSLAGIFDRADFVHFQPSLPFALLATALGAEALKRKNLFKIVIVVYCFVGIWWQGVFYKGHISDNIFFFDKETYDISNKIKQYTAPQDKIFIYGAVPHLYQMSNTLPAGNIFVFQFPWFLKVAEERVLDGIKSDQPKIIVSNPNSIIEGMQIKDFAVKINEYIDNNYVEIDHVNSTKILKRKG